MTLAELLSPIKNGLRRDQVLSTLYFATIIGQQVGLSADEVRRSLVSARIPKARDANVADVLAKCGHLVDFSEVKPGPRIWRLTSSGITHVRKLLNLPETHVEKVNDVAALSALIGSIADDEVRKYFEEALLCLQADALRACIVFAWSGTVRTIRERMLSRGEVVLNAVLVKHYTKCKHVKSIDDFAYVPDTLLIQAAQDLQLLDKSEKTVLEHALDIRNHCGHPAKYNPGAKKVSSFLEDLLSTVFGITAN